MLARERVRLGGAFLLPLRRVRDMEALQQAVAASRLWSAPAKEFAASSSGASVRASVAVRPFAAQSIGTSRTAFCYNALANKVPLSGRSGGHRAVVSMASDNAAGGYASALAELAQSAKKLDKVNEDIDKISSLIEDPQVYEFLVNPVILEDKKKEVVATLAKDYQLDEYTVSFLSLLIDKKRINLIKEIAKEFELLYNELTNTQAAIVTSAVKIENSQLALIAKKIQSLSGAQNVRLKNVIDPTLIAGFIIKYGKDGSSSIDMSVKGQLDRLAAQFEYAERAAFTA